MALTTLGKKPTGEPELVTVALTVQGKIYAEQYHILMETLTRLGLTVEPTFVPTEMFVYPVVRLVGLEREMLRLITAGRAVTNDALAQELGASKPTIKATASRLAHLGLITRNLNENRRSEYGQTEFGDAQFKSVCMGD